MLTRAAALLIVACFCLAGLRAEPAAAANNEQEIAQLRLYIQQLEDRVRQLTGENERLTHELQQLGAGTPGTASQAPPGPQALGAPVAAPVAAPLPQPGLAAPVQTGTPAGMAANAGAPEDPMTAPDASPVPGGPIDLSTLATGQGGATFSEQSQPGVSLSPAGPAQGNLQTAGLPARVPAPPQLSGNAREEYDAAYGYILTGDYGAAEARFRAWLAAFPKDAQAADAEFWLGESYYQEGKAREAATTFLNLHNSSPQSPKDPDVLVRLGMSLAKLGEKDAACATLVEVGKRYPTAAKPVQQRVAEELKRNAC